MSRSRRRALWPVVRLVVLVAVVGEGLVLLLHAAHHSTSHASALGLAALLVLTGHVLPRLAPAPPPPRSVLAPALATTTVEVGHLALAWSLDSLEHVNRVLRPRLVRVADERLRQRHRIGLRSHPEQARQLLGDDLWGVLSQPVTTLPTPAALSALLTRLEQL